MSDSDDSSVKLIDESIVGKDNSKPKKKSVEERYTKLEPREHILKRPDTYGESTVFLYISKATHIAAANSTFVYAVGSIEHVEEELFVVQDDRIVKRTVKYAPALFKIFDEIIVNAADNKQRDPKMDKLEVSVNAEENWISILNNGKGIEIEMHKEHGVYVPTLIFGMLLSGSNFDDKEKRTTGGRNGLGAKLANVFSKEFEIECVSVESAKYFRQTFRDNMKIAESPIVRDLKPIERKKGDFVKISFRPDLERFKMTRLDRDIVALLSRRAYDVAASLAFCPGKRLTVYLNKNKLPIKSFEDYISCHEGVNKPVAFQKIDRWEVGVALAEDGNGSISFVNSIATSKGGKHVDYITDQIITHLTKTLEKKKHDAKRSYIKNSLFVFVNCLIENPSFSGQTKETLATLQKDFGSKCTLDTSFFKKVDKSDIVDAVVQYSQFKDQKKLKSTGGRKRVKLTGIPKLDDANLAGSAKSKDCTLIITEGDSAKSLAMAGLSVVGRDYYGVFPLRGKPLNVRDAKQKDILANEEIKNLVNILGLRYDTKYDETNIKSLRYGHLMIMADQDTDGSHIKGLVINFFHHFWEGLLDVPGFLQQFITPIVKASKGKQQLKTFFNLPEYEKWCKSTGNDAKGWTIKYYKGLGTSTSAEAKEYFSNLDLHQVSFAKLSSDNQDIDKDIDNVKPETVQSGSDLIDMVFRKKRVEDRKKWLETTVTPETFLDYSTPNIKAEGVKFSEFINKEFILFSNYDNNRSIPHIIDGFKPSQRKVLYGSFKRKLKGEVKVAQLTGYIAEHSSYHHGEASLQGTIVAMASSYLGSNNVNLLTPSGQFGTRRMGGKDAASARYIFTKLENVTRTIFHPNDDALLNYLNDDGATIEPDFFIPVIPMILVNGAEGIGSGWSTNIPNHDPRDIIANLRRMIAGEPINAMKPYFHGFAGEIRAENDGKGSYSVTGTIERKDDTTLVITELPIRTWTQPYKEFLEKMVTGDEKHPALLLDFKENHTETTAHFMITAEKNKIDEWEQADGGLLKQFKLIGNLSTSNMHGFYEGKLVRYKTAEDILRVFYEVRHEFYIKRKAFLVKNLQIEQLKLSNKARFVEEVCTRKLIVSNRKKNDILTDLKERGYDTFFETQSAKDAKENDTDDSEEGEQDLSMAKLVKGYDYLLGMKIWSLTFEKAEALCAERDVKKAELEALEATSPKQIWLNDLGAIEVALDEREAAIEAAAKEEKEAREKSKQGQAKGSKKKASRKTSKKRKSEFMESGDSDGDVKQKPSKQRSPSSPVSSEN